MAKCSKCGKSAGIFSRLCKGCEAAIETEKARGRQEEEARTAAERIRVEQELEQHRRVLIRDKKAEFQKKLEAGQKIFLYHSEYLPVDSLLVDLVEKPAAEAFDIEPLVSSGIEGWEVVQVIPRTMGIGLKNVSLGSTTGETWGGGSGGNVIGVYILLKRELAQADINIDTPDDFLGAFITTYLVEG